MFSAAAVDNSNSERAAELTMEACVFAADKTSQFAHIQFLSRSLMAGQHPHGQRHTHTHTRWDIFRRPGQAQKLKNDITQRWESPPWSSPPIEAPTGGPSGKLVDPARAFGHRCFIMTCLARLNEANWPPRRRRPGSHLRSRPGTFECQCGAPAKRVCTFGLPKRCKLSA